MNKIGWFMGFMLFLLNAFDGVVTHFVVVYAGVAIEMNPIMNVVIEHTGSWFLVPKILIGVFLGVLIAIGWEKHRIARIGSLVVLVIYGLLAIHHVVMLTLAKGI